MALYMLDATYCLTDAGPEWAEKIVAVAGEIVATKPVSKMDRWKHKKKEYLRVVHGREAMNLATLLGELSESSKAFSAMPPALVQFAIRDARYHPKEGLSPSRG